MLNKIKELEKLARPLEPLPAERDHLFNKVKKYTDNFLEKIYDSPAFVTTEDKGIGLYDSPISETPIDIDQALNLIEYNVDRPGLNPASGGHLGYIPGGGIPHSAYGDFLAAITNRYSGVFFAGPGAVRMENMLLDWMAEIIGYPKGSVGNLTSGGSVANLIGIVTARDAHNLKAKDLEKTLKEAIDKTDVLARRFRHCAGRSLMILRSYKGRRKTVGVQQMKSHFLLAAVKKITNEFPILREARREVLEDLMDIKNAGKILEGIEKGKIKIKTIETKLPSPFALNLILQGHSDLIRIEDKQAFLRRMHKLHIENILENGK